MHPDLSCVNLLALLMDTFVACKTAFSVAFVL